MAPDLPDLSLVLTTPADAPGPRPSRWADLRLRVISAAVLLPVGLFCLWFALWSWALLVAAAALGMALEWVALCRAPRLGRAMRGAAIAAGLLYIGVPLACVIWLRADPVGVADLLFLLLIVWCGDIGAYAAGRWFGGPKLAPLISPGKTWSGAAGGLLASVLAGVVTSLALAGAASLWGLLVAALIALAGQGGDLLESAVKRWAGVKDSGRSIPGHGGLLDRLDAVLTAAPVAALFAWGAGRGVYLWL